MLIFLYKELKNQFVTIQLRISLGNFVQNTWYIEEKIWNLCKM